MNIEEARALINEEYWSDTGLDLLFRMSADVEEERVSTFITALECIENHYENEVLIERDLVNMLFGLHQTLQASSTHWKISRPKGLDSKTCFKIHETIRHIFSN